MKISNRILLMAITIIIITFSFVTNVFAETTNSTETVDSITSTPLGQSKVDITAIINEKVTKEYVQERYNMFTIEKPQSFSYDTTIYLLEYNVSTEYWAKVSEMNYKGITAPIDYSYPTIYIPVFGEITDTNGATSTRVIGHIKLSYDWEASDYKFGFSIYNLTSEDYKDMKTLWFYEEITDYLGRNKINAQQVFMIRYPSSLSDGHEKIAVIQTTDSTVILDVSNSLSTAIVGKNSNRALAYSISEYSVLRKEIEKEAYKVADGWQNNPAGGNVVLNQNENGKLIDMYWLLYSLGILLLSAVIAIVIKQIHKRYVK